MSEIRVFELYPEVGGQQPAPVPAATPPPPRSGERDVWPLLMGLPSLVVLMVYAAPGIGWWSVAVPVLLYGAGFLAYRNLVAAERARAEVVEVLSRLPEIEGLEVPGTAARRAELAQAVAAGLGLSPGDAALVATAARCRQVGRVGATVDPADRPGFDAAAVRRWSAEVVGRVGGLSDVAALVSESTEAGPRLAALRAVAEVVVAYDEAVEQGGMAPAEAVAHLTAARDEGAIPALRALRDLVAPPVPVY